MAKAADEGVLASGVSLLAACEPVGAPDITAVAGLHLAKLVDLRKHAAEAERLARFPSLQAVLKASRMLRARKPGCLRIPRRNTGVGVIDGVV